MPQYEICVAQKNTLYVLVEAKDADDAAQKFKDNPGAYRDGASSYIDMEAVISSREYVDWEDFGDYSEDNNGKGYEFVDYTNDDGADDTYEDAFAEDDVYRINGYDHNYTD